MALSSDPQVHRLLLEQATRNQCAQFGCIRNPDVLGLVASSLEEEIVCHGPGFGLGVISLERLQEVFHGPIVALAKVVGYKSEGVSKEILEFRHRLFKNWTSGFKTMFLGDGLSNAQGQKECCSKLTMEKQSEVALAFAMGHFPEVLSHLSTVPLLFRSAHGLLRVMHYTGDHVF